jgi:hypothetical protein
LLLLLVADILLGVLAHGIPHGVLVVVFVKLLQLALENVSPALGAVVFPQEEVEEYHCFYCLEGWVFLGSLDHDGEEIVEAIRCRRCGGTGRISF